MQTSFPKEFLNKFWIKVEEREYIYIFEIQFYEKKICLKVEAKQFMLILMKMAHQIAILSSKDALRIFWELKNKTKQNKTKNPYTFKQETTRIKTKCFHPVMHLRFKLQHIPLSLCYHVN